MDYQNYISQLDTWIRSAQGHLAQKELQKLNLQQIPRIFRVSIANLSRRVDLPMLALRVLNQIVRPEKLLSAPATDFEKAEYAAALIRMGVYREAEELLLEVDGEKCPQAYLYNSFIYFSCWDYKKSLPLLKFYEKSDLLSQYQKLIAKVNLISAWIAENKFYKADSTIQSLIGNSEVQKNKLLYGNLLELSAQSAILQKSYTKAESSLNQAMKFLEGSESITKFYVKKWKAIYLLQTRGANAESLLELDSVKLQAKKLRHWESIRQCDLFYTLQIRDDARYFHLVHGSPWKSYRKKIKYHYNPTENVPSTYLWFPGGKTTHSKIRIFDVEWGEELNSQVALKPGHLFHRALKSFSQDFYVPLQQGQFFASIYSGEIFNPFSSPLKIRKLISRLRTWLEKNSIPLEIMVENGGICLRGSPDYALKVSLKSISEPKYEVALAKIKKKYGKDPFTSKNIRDFLDYKSSKMYEWIQWALQKNKILQYGKTKSTFYRIK